MGKKSAIDDYATNALIGFLTRKFYSRGFQFFGCNTHYRDILIEDTLEFVKVNLNFSNETSERNIVFSSEEELRQVVSEICHGKILISNIKDYFTLLGQAIYYRPEIENTYKYISRRSMNQQARREELVKIYYSCQNILREMFDTPEDEMYYNFLGTLSNEEIFEEVLSTVCFDKTAILPEAIFDDYCF